MRLHEAYMDDPHARRRRRRRRRRKEEEGGRGVMWVTSIRYTYSNTLDA